MAARKARRRPRRAAPAGDRPAWLRRHGDFETVLVNPANNVQRIQRKRPVDRIKGLDKREIAAAYEYERLYDLSHPGAQSKLVDVRVDISTVSRDGAAVAQLQATKDWLAARDAIPAHPDYLRELAELVVYHRLSLSEICPNKGDDIRAASAALKAGLKALADWFEGGGVE